MMLIALVLVAVLLAAAGIVVFLRRRAGQGQPTAPPPEDLSWLGRRNKPCLLVAGLPGTDVETLLASVSGGRAAAAGWQVVGETLVHLVPGNVLHDADGKGWETTLRRLARRRPARPVDGLILAVPATAAEPSESAALQLRERLDRLRERLGFVLPVYVVVTGEGLTGFTEFTRALTTEQRQEMLGWSAGHRLDTDLPEDWWEEAFASLERTLARMQLALLAAPNPPPADDLLALPSAVASLRKPLARWMQPLFRPVAGEDTHFVRGLYLCGSSVFVSDLWERKVLPELRLARPASGQTAVRSRSWRAAQAATALLAISLTVGTAWEYRRLAWIRDTHVQPLLDALPHANDAAGSRLTRAFDFLETVEALEVQRFASPFLPASWNDPVDARIERILAPAFQRLVVEACRRGLEEKLRLEPVATDSEPNTAAEEVSPDLSLRFPQDPAYQTLAAHLETVAQIQEHTALYQTLRDRQPGGFSEVERLLRFLRGDAEVPAAAKAGRPGAARLGRAEFDGAPRDGGGGLATSRWPRAIFWKSPRVERRNSLNRSLPVGLAADRCRRQLIRSPRGSRVLNKALTAATPRSPSWTNGLRRRRPRLIPARGIGPWPISTGGGGECWARLWTRRPSAPRP